VTESIHTVIPSGDTKSRRIQYVVLETAKGLVCIGKSGIEVAENLIKIQNVPGVFVPIDSSEESPIILETNSKSGLIEIHIPEKSVTLYTANQVNDGNEFRFTLSAHSNQKERLQKIKGYEELTGKVNWRLNDPAYIILRNTSADRIWDFLYIGTLSYVDNDDPWPGEDAWKPLDLDNPMQRGIEYFKPSVVAPEVLVSERPSEFLSPLRLIENTQYYWALLVGPTSQGLNCISDAIEGNTRLTGDNYPSFRGNANTYLKRTGKLPSGTFNFKNFLGTVTIMLGGREILRAESTSQKIDYENEYLRMLDDLTEESLGNILNLNSITSAHLNSKAKTDKTHVFGRFLLLKAALPLARLRSAAALIRAKPHTSLKTSTKWVPSSMANGRHAMSDPIGRIRWADHKLPTNRPVPYEVLEEKRLETTDTPPNQFTKFVLHDFAELCEAIAGKSQQVGSRYSVEAREYALECRRQLRAEHLSSCTDMRRIPFENLVIQRRSGYRDVFRAWAKSNLGLRIRELKSNGILSTEVENRDAPKLYELWLISHLKKALRGLSENSDTPLYEYLPEHSNEEEIQLFPEGGKYGRKDPIYVTRDTQGNLLALYYNKSFIATSRLGKTGGESAPKPGASYTVELHPDYTIEIVWHGTVTDEVSNLEQYKKVSSNNLPQNGGSSTYIHFDAKFRINDVKNLSESDPTKAKPSDIYKMHTYIEAIYGTATSIILYPGTTDAKYNKFIELIPGVAALAIKPDRTQRHSSGQGEGERESEAIRSLKEYIGKIIDASKHASGVVTEPPAAQRHIYTNLRAIEISALKSLKSSR